VVVVITALSVIIGELVPKRIALANSERIAGQVARPLQILATVFQPFVWVLERASSALLAALRIPERRGMTVTEEEVRFAIAEGTEAGVIDEIEQEMIHGVLALADRSVVAVMTPRPDVYWIDLDHAPELLQREIVDCPFARLVAVRGGDVGRPLGVIQKNDLVNDLIVGGGLQTERHLRQPLYVPENVPVLRLLEMFRSAPLHVAFVVDEYGDFLGLATLTDVLRGIARTVPEERQFASEQITRRPDGSWLVDGRVPIDVLVDRLGLASIDGDFHTAAGLALDRLARIPVEGDRFELNGWTVEVVDMDGNRIDKLLFTPSRPTKTS
jgi:putative hemolysin